MTAVMLTRPDERTFPATMPAGFVLAACAAASLAVAVSAPLPGPAVVWGSVALAAWCAALLCLTAAAADRRGLGLAEWKIGAWSLAWCAVTSGLATAAWSPVQQDAGAEIAITSVMRALWLLGVAMTAWAAGYTAGPHRIAARAVRAFMARMAARYPGEVRSAAVPWVLYLTGTAARLAGLALTGRLGYVGDSASAASAASGYQQVLNLLSLAAPLGVAVSAFRTWREGRPRALPVTLFLFACEVTFGAIAGGKQNFAVAVLALAIPWSASRRRLPKRILAGGVLVFVFLVIPFTSAYRSAASGGTVTLGAGQAASGAPAIFRRVASGVSLPAAGQSLSYLAQRVQEIDGPAIIMQRTPSQIPFVSAAQLAEAPVAAVIPRALWAGKPVLADGYQFSQQYYGLPPGVYTYSAITPAGDLYRHGGWIPVVAGMFLLGCAIRVLDDVLDVQASPPAALLVLLLFPAIVKAETDWVTLLATTPGVVLAWLIAVRFSFARRSEP